MIAACPTCGARYRIDVAKLRPEGARLRCARCEAVFRVRPPADAAAPVAAVLDETPEPVAAPAPAPPVQAPAPAPAAPSAPAAPAREQTRLVLVADSEPTPGKSLASTLRDWGFEALLVHDGVEAILAVQRSLPRVVVLDAALPKMFGFQVCELVKRNESLKHIHVVLVGAIHHQQRYRRPPGELYGADVYIERHQLPDALAPILEGFGLPPASARLAAPPRPEAAPVRRAPEPPLPPPPAREAAAPAPARPAPRMPRGDGLDEARAQAERLARIIVSDIVLYNEQKFEEGVRSGDVVAALDAELEEGRALFAARIDPRVGGADEFLQRELLRVARGRGMAE
jgi:predicted Zn finger-like uncharacterized protein